MDELIEKENIKIESMIYEIRGRQVMLDSDLAKLYQCANGTKSINLAVKRNFDKFPEDFCFRLTQDESKIIWFQIETINSNLETRGGKYQCPYVFTEEGVAMLSSVLHTKVASKVSVNIMRAFVEMRKYIASNNYDKRISNIETQLIEQNNKNIEYENNFDKIFNKLDNKVNNHLFFDGQIYDAYSLLLDIFNEAKESIVIIDNYIDKKLLDILSKTEKQILVITNKYNNIDYEKYKRQYKNVNIKINNKIHDRFIIIDNNILYHCGSSFKDLGNKCFAISKIEDTEYLNKLLINIK